MSTDTVEAIDLSAQCLCKANTFKTTITRSTLPLTAHICQCNSCRHTSGGLYTSVTSWTASAADMDTSRLKKFRFSENVDMFFCPTCSSPMFCAWSRQPERLAYVFTGVLSNEDADLLKLSGQRFVADTVDGGASPWLLHSNADGVETKRFDRNATDKELPRDWPPLSSLTGYEGGKEDAVPIRCKCNGVDFILHRGEYSKTEETDLPSNVDPRTHKLLADFCGCTACRAQSGVDVFNWTYVEMKHLSFSTSDRLFPAGNHALQKAVDAGDPAVGTLRYYNSSKGVSRYFCGECSCCIFYHTDRRPSSISVAVGALWASDGARAEGLLSWDFEGPLSSTGRIGGWRQGFYERVQKGLDKYREERKYPQNWLRLTKEKTVLQ
ncbi:hypothetical protein ACN47E_002799 [Coniothyrium glycines]